MSLRHISLIIALLLFVLAGCATPQPRFRQEAVAVWNDAGREGYALSLPSGYRQLHSDLSQGEKLLHEGEVEEADQRYQEVIRRGRELKRQNAEVKAREEAERVEEAARLKAEALKLEAERLRVRQEEELRLARAKLPPPPPPPPIKVEREPPRPAVYTVKRGETLPQIAARPTIYGDSSLWPLIYRANRDQIRDPKRLWPGQILRIPRNVGKEEMAEARRFAQGKQMP
jgi:hypothetical protein